MSGYSWFVVGVVMSVTVTVVTACGAITFLIVRGDQLLSSHHTVTRNGFTAADEGGGQGRTANLLVPMIRRKELVYTAQRYLQQHIYSCRGVISWDCTPTQLLPSQWLLINCEASSRSTSPAPSWISNMRSSRK